MSKAFASTADMQEKKITFSQIGEGCYAYTAEGDPNSGIIVGDDGCMIIDTQATPIMAAKVMERLREVTDKPVKYVLLSHYHAVRVLGASAYGAEAIIASRPTYELIVERGQEDYESEVGRFPRLFDGVESVPGLTWPTIVFDGRLSVDLGNRKVEIIQIGKGHTQGDTVAWLPKERVLFAGDLVEYNATPYTGDAHLTDWPETLDRVLALGPVALVPGRGDALTTPEMCREAILMTKSFVSDLFAAAREGAVKGSDLKAVYEETRRKLDPKYGQWVIYEHCMPFDVSRAFDEARGVERPKIWTAERDQQMWAALQG